jgi:periplasmic divalent cation tolerance protein
VDPSEAPAIVLVLTTLDEGADAQAFARTLVDERLAACVNIVPAIESVYRWQGAVEAAREQLLVIKTTTERLEDVKVRLAALHPYEVPEVLVVPVLDAAPAYRAWLLDGLRGV